MTYYLHRLDGSRLHIDSVIIVSETSDPPTVVTGLVSNGTNCCMDKSWMLGPVETRNEAVGLATAIARRYNWDVEIDGQPMRLPQEYIDRREAAAAMGAATGEAKRAAARENGRKGGRPRKPREE